MNLFTWWWVIHIYLIEDNKLKSFINEFINSEESINKVIKETMKKNPKNVESILKFKEVIEKENKSMTIDINKISKQNIDNNQEIKDFLSHKSKIQKNKTIRTTNERRI